jgi:integrase/recombinase XerD
MIPLEMDRLDLSVIQSLTILNRTSPLSENTIKTYQKEGRLFNEYLLNTRQSVGIKSLQSYLYNDHNLMPSTVDLKRDALLRIILAQPQFTNNSLHRQMIKNEILSIRKRHQASKAVMKDSYLTFAEIEQLKDSIHDKKTELVIDFLFQTGVRVSEMINIQLHHIKIDKTVKIFINGKGAKARYVYITPSLFCSIKSEFESKTYLFETSKGTKYFRNNIYTTLMLVGERFGAHLNPHKLRHSCAMHLKDRGAELRYISKYLGHSKTSVTADFYFHDQPDEEILAYFVNN